MKFVTPVNVFFALWAIVLLVSFEFYYDHLQYYLYLSIIMIFPVMIWNLIKQRKNDKNQRIKELQCAVNRMMIFAVVIIILFAITQHNNI